MNNPILCIDPGANGAFVFHDPNSLQQVDVEPMHETEGDICDYLQGVRAFNAQTTVYLEQVGGFVAGGEGKSPGSAMFNFGRNYGFILGCCAALGLRVELVTPQKWQKGLVGSDIKGPDRKRALKAIAQRLYPGTKLVTLKTCDALLILEWAKKQQAALSPCSAAGEGEGN